MKHYVIKDGKVHRKNPFCPRCGCGVFMADHGDFWVCGKCGIRCNKKFFGKTQETVSRTQKHGDVNEIV